jgi:hypothetical protein
MDLIEGFTIVFTILVFATWSGCAYLAWDEQDKPGDLGDLFRSMHKAA